MNFFNHLLFVGEYELTSLKHQYEGMVPGKTLEIPENIKVSKIEILKINVYIFINKDFGISKSLCNNELQR